MQEKIREVATRIKALRENLAVSIDDMADHLKVSAEKYTEYEKGESDIPASILFGIAHRLNIDMTVLLTGEDPHMKYFTVTRKDKGVAVERRTQYKYQSMAANFIHKKAEPFLVTVEPQSPGKTMELNTHPGQEFDYVIQGVLKVYIHGNELVLREGDSIYFDSGCPHAMEAMEKTPAKFLAVIF